MGKLQIPEGPVDHTCEELAEIMTLRARATRDPLAGQLLAAGAEALKQEVVIAGRLRAQLTVQKAEQAGLQVTLVIGGCVLCMVGLWACLAGGGLILLGGVMEYAFGWAQKWHSQRRPKPKAEPEAR